VSIIVEKSKKWRFSLYNLGLKKSKLHFYLVAICKFLLFLQVYLQNPSVHSIDEKR